MRTLIFNRKFLYIGLCLTVIICMIAALTVINQPSFTDTADTSSLQSSYGSASSSADNESDGNVSSDTSSDPVSSLPDDSDGEIEVSVEELAGYLVDGMSLEQKIYQMFIVSPEAVTGTELVTEADSALLKGLENYQVGGFIYFADNLRNTEQTNTLLSTTQVFANQTQALPLFLCVDEEGGSVLSIGSNPDFGVDEVPPMTEIDSEQDAYNAGDTIGRYLAELGFNVNFAPNSDVLTNPLNTSIGDRSFGSDTQRVVKYALQYANGLKSNGIMATYKHFPGHGATLGDTHEGYAEIERGLDDLRDNEFMPFASASQNGIDFIMTGHISIPAVDGDTPASLSPKITRDILINELGYRGIIITDALNLSAVTKYYDADEAAIMAIKAGNDMLLCPASVPEDIEDVVDAILDAVNSGELSEDNINASVKKIVAAKLKMQQEG